ncbi:hypothetical protein GCM10012320_31840 [Sinomonas cellulolyticus]|jgi:hypothetical protein|uniref:Uncharacterized protein n=1 Tax=Sinomonas cellulolyticus TaxID=2801916 RepID=A0ABS1JZW9_9MICC|nr:MULTISPECIES: hypothetical protein [Sinomonas]MBL0704202.1 hypothetical protein [Sinomonas cellulolyticus]GHG58245.1 hypothetical protein GCM10012320_31840 [Sinomonas sp. KCTC 49339]
MHTWDNEYAQVVTSQPVTESDRNSEVLRIPGSALTAFPIVPTVVTVSVGGTERSVLWSPRSNERRSGTLAVGNDVMSGLPEHEAVRIGVRDEVFHLLVPCPAS